MQTADFQYDLPPELIAQVPALERDQSRLLVLDRNTGNIGHQRFPDLLDHLKSGDVLVLNNSRVIPARLFGHNERTGGRFELLLLEPNGVNDWWAMLRPGKRARVGARIRLEGAPHLAAEVIDTNADGHRRLRITGAQDLMAELERIGRMPVPPYIGREDDTRAAMDRDRYQTVYAATPGSVAAPTAGLHFTAALLDRARALGVEVVFVTLHVGPGTFAPVKAAAIADHVMHEERYDLGPDAAEAIQAARNRGGRVWAVGTTTVRVLEGVAARHGGLLQPGPGRTRIFIHPPYRFQVVDHLVTNFHLPGSTLLMLVSAFCAPGQIHGREIALASYAEAVRARYRFFSYGDAMLIL